MEFGKDSDEMSSVAGVQRQLMVGAVGDRYEQEADRVAAQVMRMSVATDHSPQVQRFGEEDNPVQRWSLAQSITPVVHRQVDEQVQMHQLVQRAFQAGGNQASGDLESRLNASKGGGSALAPEVRAFMEPRFGADFSSVRVHTGTEAVQMNRELGAQAFAHGSDVYFGAGKSPGNNELTAHELTHVVQQTGVVQRQVDSRHSTSSTKLSDSITQTSDSSIQRSFIATGDRAGFLSLANRIIGVQYQVRSNGSGNLSIVNTNVQGPPTREASVLISLLQKLINDPNTTTIEFIRGRSTTTPVIVGSYVLSQIDLDDIEAFGSGEGVSSASTLVHEIEEQYRKQVHAETYGIAHASGINLENQVTGAVRGSEVPLTPAVQHPDGTVSVTLKIPYTYPDGRIVDVVLIIDHSKITNVTRTERPRP
jgi:hypothetical protein